MISKSLEFSGIFANSYIYEVIHDIVLRPHTESSEVIYNTEPVKLVGI